MELFETIKMTAEQIKLETNIVSPSELQRTPRPDAGPQDCVRLFGRGDQQASGGNPTDAAAAETPEEGGRTPEKGGQHLDGGSEVLLVTAETSSQHRVQRRLLLNQGGTVVEEKR